MQISRRHALAAVGVAAVSLPTAGRAQSSSTIRIGVTPTEAQMPFAYARRAGLFDRAGLQLDVTRGSTGASLAVAVAGGALDIGATSILGLMAAHLRGIPFTIVAPAGVYLPTTEGGLIVAANSPLRAPRDFVGKTMSIAALNDITMLGMKAWMDQAGVDPNSVKYIELPQLSAPAAIESGRVDAAGVSNPAFSNAMSSGKFRFVANIYSAISPRFLIAAWFSTTGWVERNRAAAERFAHVMGEASNYVNTHVDETVVDLAEQTGIERAVAAKMKRTHQVPNVVAAEIQPVLDVAAKYKAIERTFPAAEIISDAALR